VLTEHEAGERGRKQRASETSVVSAEQLGELGRPEPAAAGTDEHIAHKVRKLWNAGVTPNEIVRQLSQSADPDSIRRALANCHCAATTAA
jgi:hypothetical protein